MSEVWGTVAVNDHKDTDAFIRDVLLFDRLVVPVPATPEERERWKAPNPKDPTENWDPDHLDEVIAILGTQRRPNAHKSSPLVWEADWSEELWLSRRKVSDDITQYDAFEATRRILAKDKKLPQAVEAIAAYPSERDWRTETSTLTEQPDDLNASDALLILAYPLLVPDVGNQDPLVVLEDAAGLARNPDFREQRDAFYNWLRGYLFPFQSSDVRLGKLQTDVGSMHLARQQLQGQLQKQAELLKKRKRSASWDRVQWVCVGAAASAAIVAAVIVAPPVAAAVGLAPTAAALMGAGWGTGGTIAGLGGWFAGRRAQTPEPRALNGASMFGTAAGKFDYELPTLPQLDQAIS
jgi:hypothetical protein